MSKTKENIEIASESSECLQNELYVRFEDRKKKERLEDYPKFTSSLLAVHKAFDELSSRINLNQETHVLMGKVNADFSELSQFITDEQFSRLNNEFELEDILKNFKTDLKNLKNHLKQVPYSNSPLIDNLYKALNRFLEVLYNFLMNGPVVAEGVYIATPSQPYHSTLFHPAQPIDKSLKDLSAVLNSSSLA